MSKRNHTRLKFGLLLGFFLLSVWATFQFNLFQLFSVEAIREVVLSTGGWAILVFILLYIAGAVLPVPSTPFTLAGGILFGPFWGTIYTLVGAVLGASLAFALAKYLGESFVTRWVRNNFKKLHTYDKRLEEHGFVTVFILRLIPLVPFSVLNYALGLTRVRFRPYLLATATGIIPGTFGYVLFGSALVKMDVFALVFALLLLVVLSILLVVYKKSFQPEVARDPLLK